MTTGGSAVKVAEMLERNGIKVTDVAVLIDREQGAKAMMEAKGYQLHAVITAKGLFTELHKGNKMTDAEWDTVQRHLEKVTA